MKYKVGDKVLIRQWDDMVAEFGVDGDGDIYTKPMFIAQYMKEFCGTVVTISYSRGYYEIIEGNGDGWWSDDMIERKVEERMDRKFKIGDMVKSRTSHSVKGEALLTPDNICVLKKINIYGNERLFIVSDVENNTWALKEYDIELVKPIDTVPIFKLETGQVIKLRNGNKYVVLCKQDETIFMGIGDNGRHKNTSFMSQENYDVNLKARYKNDKYDIIKIYEGGKSIAKCILSKEILWERIEPKRMTIADVETAMGYQIEIVGEDEKND